MSKMITAEKYQQLIIKRTLPALLTQNPTTIQIYNIEPEGLIFETQNYDFIAFCFTQDSRFDLTESLRIYLDEGDLPHARTVVANLASDFFLLLNYPNSLPNAPFQPYPEW